jgi:hypothetical protein
VGPSREWLFTLIYLPRVSVTSGRDNSLRAFPSPPWCRGVHTPQTLQIGIV